MSTICQSAVLQIFFHSVSLLKVYLEAYTKHNFFFHSINPVGELALCHFMIVMFSLCGLVCDYPFFPPKVRAKKGNPEVVTWFLSYSFSSTWTGSTSFRTLVFLAVQWEVLLWWVKCCWKGLTDFIIMSLGCREKCLLSLWKSQLENETKLEERREERWVTKDTWRYLKIIFEPLDLTEPPFQPLSRMSQRTYFCLNWFEFVFCLVTKTWPTKAKLLVFKCAWCWVIAVASGAG